MSQWTAFLLALLGACTSASAALDSNRGFCANGAYPSTTWPEGKPERLEIWGSYCAQGAQTTGSATSTPFRAPASLSLYLAGFPDSSGISLALENLADHSQLYIRPHENPGARWLEYTFVVPREWVGKSVRLVASDNATGIGGWLGFSEPVPAPAKWNLRETADLLVRSISHSILLLLPCLALCAYAASRGVRNAVVISLIALAGTAAPGYALFWLWLLSPRIGHALSFLLAPLAAAACVVFWRRLDRAGRAVLQRLLLPATLVFLSSLWIVAGGFAYGGMRTPFPTAWTRFSHPLPPDNMIPFLFAEGVRYGHVPSPLLGDWLSSDRPPLQSAIALSQYPYLPQPRALGTEALSVLLQSTWILAIWILLVAFRIDRRAIRLVLATALFSGFTVLNSFFVWPKLLAAAYIIPVVAILLSRNHSLQIGDRKLLSVLAGVLTAWGLLSHGGSVFALGGLIFTCLFLRKRFPMRALALTCATCIVLYLPWMLYQKFYDPPGNRLLKTHLAGVDKVDGRGTSEALIAAYRSLSLRTWLKSKEANVTMVSGDQSNYWPNVQVLLLSALGGNSSAATRAASDLRQESFFHLSSSLGFLCAAPIFLLAGLAKQYRTPPWRLSCILWLSVLCTLVPWCLVMFTAGGTSIHAGTYVVVLLAITASVLALWAMSRWLAYAVCGLQIVQSVLVYGVFMRGSTAGDALLEGTVHYGNVTLCAVAMVLCCWTLLKMPGGEVTAREAQEDH